MSRSLRCSLMVLLATTGACSIFGDFSGFTGGADAPDVSDGDAAGQDGGTTDGGGGGDIDATPKDDAGDVDAQVDRCTVAGLVTRICDAFDRTALRVAPWTGGSTNNGATGLIAIDPTTGSRVFRATVPARGADFAQSFLSLDTTVTSRFQYAFDVKYDALPTSMGRQTMTAKVGADSQVYVSFTPTGITIVEQGSSTFSHPILPVPPAGTWFRLSIDVDLATDKMVVLVDGASALPSGETFPVLPSFSGTNMTFGIGLRYSAAPSDAMAISIDDVLIATN